MDNTENVLLMMDAAGEKAILRSKALLQSQGLAHKIFNIPYIALKILIAILLIDWWKTDKEPEEEAQA